MKLGIYTCCSRTLPFEERIRVISETGFNTISFDFTDTYLDTVMTHSDQVDIANKYGLEIQATHLSGDKMTTIWSECDDAEFVTQRLINELADLKDLGLKTGIAHVTWGYSDPGPVSQSALNRFLRIAEAAEHYQVRVALENSVYAEHVHFLLDHIHSDYVGFCYDSGHENAFAPNEKYLERYGDRLFAMHLHDNYGEKDEHNIPFNGTVNWNEKMALLRKTKYFEEFGLTLELGCGEGDFRQYMEKAYEAASKLMTL